VPPDSGRISGNLKRPRRYDRRLLRVFDLAANISVKTCTESRNYHDRKRSEGKLHSKAVLCLARRRLNILWAMQRDNNQLPTRITTRRLTISLRLTVTLLPYVAKRRTTVNFVCCMGNMHYP